MKYIKWYYKITRQLTQYDKKKNYGPALHLNYLTNMA